MGPIVGWINAQISDWTNHEHFRIIYDLRLHIWSRRKPDSTVYVQWVSSKTRNSLVCGKTDNFKIVTLIDRMQDYMIMKNLIWFVERKLLSRS